MSDGGIQWYQEVGIQQEYECWLDSIEQSRIQQLEQEPDMANIREFTDSKYLKKEDVKGPTLVTIRTVGKENVALETQPKKVKAVIKFDEFDKPMVFNSTNLKRAAKAIGSEETNDWIGKQIVLYVDEEVEFGGEIVGGLRVRKVQAKTAEGRVKEMEDDVPF